MFKEMYNGIANSPTTTITKTLFANSVEIDVENIDYFPNAPNFATLMTDDGKYETIKYELIEDLKLKNITRDIEGTGIFEFPQFSKIGRYFNNNDYQSLIDNVNYLNDANTIFNATPNDY